MHISAMSCACRSVGKPGKGWVSTATRAKAAAVPRHPDAGRRLLDLDAASSATGLSALLQEIGAGAVEKHVAAGHGRGHGVGAGLDAVGQHGMLGAMKTSHALDLQGRAADAARSWRPS